MLTFEIVAYFTPNRWPSLSEIINGMIAVSPVEEVYKVHNDESGILAI